MIGYGRKYTGKKRRRGNPRKRTEGRKEEMEGKQLFSLTGDEQIFFFAYFRKRKANKVV